MRKAANNSFDPTQKAVCKLLVKLTLGGRPNMTLRPLGESPQICDFVLNTETKGVGLSFVNPDWWILNLKRQFYQNFTSRFLTNIPI